MRALSKAPSMPIVKSTRSRPGRICGQRWSPSLGSALVIASHGPPAAFTRMSPVGPEKMIWSSSPQLPPYRFAFSHSVVAEPRVLNDPPATGTFLRWPRRAEPVKKANHCPSGEKNGRLPNSVPTIGCPSIRFKSRTQGAAERLRSPHTPSACRQGKARILSQALKCPCPGPIGTHRHCRRRDSSTMPKGRLSARRRTSRRATRAAGEPAWQPAVVSVAAPASKSSIASPTSRRRSFGFFTRHRRKSGRARAGMALVVCALWSGPRPACRQGCRPETDVAR